MMENTTQNTLVADAITLPSGAGYLRIVDGTAWFAHDIRDIVLKAGDTIALDKRKVAVISPLHRQESVTYEILDN